MGRHAGHHEFTIGQRRGIGVAAPEPLYVVDKDARSNTVVVGPREALAIREIRLEDPVLHREASRVDAVRLRYHAPAKRCRASDRAERLELEQPAEAAAPGQLACLLSGDTVVGYGTIATAK